VGPAADTYALGCVLYEMLVGDPPHVGRTAQAVLGKIITEPPASETKQRKTVPPNVEATVNKALEKVPADRFLRAADFAAALGDSGFRHGAAAYAGDAMGGRTSVTGWGRWKLVTLTAIPALVLGAALGR